eukprot:GHVL01022807.1.p1 GENE.GHVL01022807.1~~GHVL01022807.1.p1  ORF type:complete len:305 (+),score=35.76 GHVL01022807.1:58-915(+)
MVVIFDDPLDLSFLEDYDAFSHKSKDDVKALKEETEKLLDYETLKIAPVSSPMTYCNDIKLSKMAPKLMDFSKGTTTLGFVIDGGVIIAVDARATMGSFINSSTVRKVIEINDRILGTMAGGAADCSYWERHLARVIRLYELRNKNRISVAAASNILANIFFQYKGYGLSCGTMVTGYDKKGPQLYMVDDRGDRIKGNRFSVGSGSTYAYGVMDRGLKPGISVEDAVELAKLSIYHATHRDAASGGVCRVYHVHENGWTVKIEAMDVNEIHKEYTAKRGTGLNDM